MLEYWNNFHLDPPSLDYIELPKNFSNNVLCDSLKDDYYKLYEEIKSKQIVIK